MSCKFSIEDCEAFRREAIELVERTYAETKITEPRLGSGVEAEFLYRKSDRGSWQRLLANSGYDILEDFFLYDPQHQAECVPTVLCHLFRSFNNADEMGIFDVGSITCLGTIFEIQFENGQLNEPKFESILLNPSISVLDKSTY